MSAGWRALSTSMFEGMHRPQGDILTFAQRSWNARATTLAAAVLGWISVPIVAVLPVPQGRSAILAVMVVTNLALSLAHLLTRTGRLTFGVLLLVLSAFAQHIAMIREPFAALVVPYFAAVPVLIGAACLPRRAIPMVVLLGVLALSLEWGMARASGVPVDVLQRTFVPAAVLLTLTAIVAWLAVTSLERGYELAREHENQQKVLMSELEQRTRLAALGQLTAGIAHDFNNFLLVVQASVDLAEQTLERQHPARAELDQIRSAAGRAARLSQELLGFSRKREAPAERIRPAAVLGEVAPLLQRLLGAQNRLRIESGPRDLTVFASPMQVEQVLFNLVSNARDASPSGSEIVVYCRARTVANEAKGSIPPGQYVELAVEDQGTGISEDVRPHLFEPFFTTKTVGSGTGLGLSTCQAIATQLGGTITVETALGHGSTFALVLPVQRTFGEPFEPRPHERGTVGLALVVDDDAEVRALVARLLESAGVSALQADGARSALDLARTSAPLDLIVTDVVLGGGSVSTLSEFRRLHPAARLVVMSSLAPDTAMFQQLGDGGATFLQKPFAAAQILALVRGADVNLRSVPVPTSLA